MKYKIAPILIIALAIFAICFSGCDTAYIDNSMYSTTEPTTLSAEEIEKNKIIDIRDELINSELPNKFGFSNIKMTNYCYLQNYIEGAKKNPDEFFFLGTSLFSLSQLGSNTKYYQNKDVLSFLQEHEKYDGDYIFSFIADVPDDYGRVNTTAGAILIAVKDDGGWMYSVYVPENTYHVDLGYLIFNTIPEKTAQYTF